MALTGNTRFDAVIIRKGSPPIEEVLMVLQVEETFEDGDSNGSRWRNAKACDITAQIDEPAVVADDRLPDEFPVVGGFTSKCK